MNNLKLGRSIYKTLLMLCMAGFLFTSCDDDDDGSGDPTVNQNIVQVAQDRTDLETFVTALTAADLVNAFTGTDDFTIFAPSNEAFAALGSTLDDLLLPENQEELANILRYHVVENKRLSTALSTTELNTLLQFRTVSITVGNDGSVSVNDASVTTPDLEATNGVIHIIDEVLIPPAPTLAQALTIAGADTGDDGLSILLGILSSDGYQDLLTAASTGTDPLTIFAPTNAAFISLLNTLGLTLAELTPEVVRDIIEYHILPQAAPSSALMAQGYPTLLEGESITVTLDPIRIDDIDVVQADIEASNGVVHVIGGVLLPSEPAAVAGTVVGVAYFNSEFTTLVTALRTAELIPTLLMDGPYTVFAPDNAAFEAAGITNVGTLTKEQLDPILLYHVLGGEFLADGLGETQQTLNTANVYFSVNGENAFINGAAITATDIQASNGVVHTIGRALTPPPGNLVELASSQGYDRLADALTEAGLVVTLQGDGPFTVFAPTDAAFDALYASLDGVNGPADLPVETLTDILLYHVLDGRIFSSGLSDGQQATTLSDANAPDPTQFTINIGESVTITDIDTNNADATVGPVDKVATNGVIHEIDAVLLPVTL